MATYKAEFLAHHYKGRLRPRTAYTMGLVHWTARLAARAPRLANGLAGAPLLAGLAKRLAGVAPGRDLPAVAGQTFTRWFRARPAPPGAPGRPPVLLFPDTFTDHFHPAAGRAAVRVLEAAGFAVRVPDRPLCCGRPLYDFGMLDLAKRQLRRILAALGPAVDAGVPVVVLEPSCLAAFRDELPNLLPGHAAERLVGGTVGLAELLAGRADGWRPPRVGGRAIVQGHCHQQAVIGMDPDLELLAAAGVEAELLDAGCCGMAGAFGFEADHYPVAMAVGERRLLPAVRTAAPGTMVLADGFSCRTQIEQATGRRPLHLAELLASALHARQS
jgi:Fe-S oxidoreductase